MPYDVVITGGRVIDAGRDVDANLDVAIENGRIAKVAADIDVTGAARTIDARGKLVTPGLIDVHTHIFEHGVHIGVNPDIAGVHSGVTTIVDAGSAGSANYEGFHHHVLTKASTRVLTNIHIAQTGLAFVPEAKDASDVNLDETIAMIDKYKGEIIGVKVRACGPAANNMGIDYIMLAITAAREAGVRLMVHIGDPFGWGTDPAITAKLLPLLQPDDMMTHLYTNAPGKVLNDANQVLPELLDARDRGVAFDPAHGRSNLSFDIAERMLEQDVKPLSISTDLTKPGRGSLVKSMTHTMNKFLALGFTLNEVIRMSSYNPAGMIHMQGELGTLAEGTTADVSILREVQGRWTFDDASGNTIGGEKALEPVLAFKDGEQFSVDYGPFPWGWLPNAQ
ncbi:MAG: amidohydrolase/deacetylase family metallohydrolase [Dehalococcoidia bacterium]